MAWVAEPNGDIIWYNQRWYDYTGTTIEQMFGWGWRDVHHPDHVDRVVERISEAFRTGEPWKDTFRSGAPTASTAGSCRWHNPIAGRTGPSCVVRDQHRYHRAQGPGARLARHAIDLRRSNEELEQFAYVASHDLKAPLRGIENLVGWIEEDLEGSLTGDVQTNMELLKSRVRRLDSLLDDLLAYSRAGRADATMDTVDTKALVEELAVLVSPPEASRSRRTIPCRRCGRPGPADPGLAEPDRQRHQASRPAGRGAYPGRGQACGGRGRVRRDRRWAGHSRAVPRAVFGMFQTLKPRDEVEGSGMGLAIVRKLVDRQAARSGSPTGRRRGLAVHFTWPRDGRKGHADGLNG